jgi:hypothetical protein
VVTTRLGTGPDGRPVVLKEADASSAAALEREADVLGIARHPGVVEVAWTEVLADTDGFRVALRWAGGRTASDLRAGVEGAAAVVAAVAMTVADLHGVGVRHGAIRAEHVVLDGEGRPVLCGFGSAGRAGMPAAPTEADDVAALGELLRALVGADVDVEPIPEHRFGRRRGFAGATPRALLTLADHATADDVTLRPSARGFAAALAATIPGEPAPATSTARWRVPAAAVGVGLLAWGVSAVLRSPSAPRTLEVPTTTTVDAVVDGNVVELDGVRYAVGRPGDVLAVGDWDCDGTATVAAVRPTTGEVFLFERWASPGDDVVVAPTARVDGAARVEPAGCDALAVVDADGERTVVPA